MSISQSLPVRIWTIGRFPRIQASIIGVNPKISWALGEAPWFTNSLICYIKNDNPYTCKNQLCQSRPRYAMVCDALGHARLTVLRWTVAGWYATHVYNYLTLWSSINLHDAYNNNFPFYTLASMILKIWIAFARNVKVEFILEFCAFCTFCCPTKGRQVALNHHIIKSWLFESMDSGVIIPQKDGESTLERFIYGFFDLSSRAVGIALVFIAVILITAVIYLYFAIVWPYKFPHLSLRACVHLTFGAFAIPNIYYTYFKSVFTTPGVTMKDVCLESFFF